ncbi:GNAT family N-acetyltransferase [Velocimicrobium porci]|nr:GNAT family N-acetyltransferase [Velocimicrobium porci]
MSIQIRRFCENDAEAVAYIINQDLLHSDKKAYSRKENVLFTNLCAKEQVLSIEKFTHMYVAYLEKKPVGCGIITDCSKKQNMVFLVPFVLPEHQGQGLGKQIIEALEQDSYYSGAGQIEIPLSIDAKEFYQKIGYDRWQNEVRKKQQITA